MNTNDEFDYQILKLTNDFYNTYPNPPYTEILEKNERSYNCLLIQTNYDFFICIPYRSEITHRYAYRFRNSVRSTTHKSGLDYTKIVIVKDSSFLNNTESVIDQDEYVETRNNIQKIKEESQKFVKDYMNQIAGKFSLNSREFSRRYSYSPLKYFHKELGV